MGTTIFRNGLIRTLTGDGSETCEWLVIDGDTIVAAGAGDPPAADRTVDIENGVLIPAFCDGHVHLPATGLYESGMDFRGEHSADAILDAFAARARAGGSILFGGNFEDPLDRPLGRADLDRAVGERSALLARADMHSCIVSSALLDSLDVVGLEGVDVDADGMPTGYLREKAAAEAWRWFDASLPRPEQKSALKAAVRRAYSMGVARVHEMYVVEWRGWAALDVLGEVAREVALDISPCIATTEIDRIVEMDLPRVGGDWFLDGSFGSHTAWLTAPYDPAPPAGSPPRGITYRSDEEVLDFFLRAQRAGLQTGVHAIGDAAIEQAIAGWEQVAVNEGLEPVRALRHRIEHFECATDDHIRRAARLGLGASVQPAFDLYWGGEDGLYARRMGWARAAIMNRFRTMMGAGLIVGAGSDSTVTPLDPFLQMKALRTHHRPEERLTGLEALVAHTLGSQSLTRSEKVLGTLEPGKLADLAWLGRDPVDADPGDLESIPVRGTWVRGVRSWPPGSAESD